MCLLHKPPRIRSTRSSPASTLVHSSESFGERMRREVHRMLRHPASAREHSPGHSTPVSGYLVTAGACWDKDTEHQARWAGSRAATQSVHVCLSCIGLGASPHIQAALVRLVRGVWRDTVRRAGPYHPASGCYTNTARCDRASTNIVCTSAGFPRPVRSQLAPIINPPRHGRGWAMGQKQGKFR